MQTSSGKTLQDESPTKELPEGRPRLENDERRKEEGRQVLIQLRRALPHPRSSNWGVYHIEWLSDKIVPRT